jgi:hypothetical protein
MHSSHTLFSYKALKKINLENNRIKDEMRSAIIRKFKERVHV